MQDRNGVEIKVGDTVKFFPRGVLEEWYSGKVIYIETEWDYGSLIAHIHRENDPIPVFRRFSRDIEVCRQ